MALRLSGLDRLCPLSAILKLGQRTIEMARHYAKGADLAPKMRKVVNTLDEEFERRIKPSDKPTGKVSNSGPATFPKAQESV